MQLTKNFKSEEFVVSKQFPLLLKEIKLTEFDLYKLYILCKTALQPLRDFMQCPVIVSSGKRSDALNDAVRGEGCSEHLFRGYFCAADVTIETQLEELYKAHRFLEHVVPSSIGRAILYLRKSNLPKHIHVSLPTEKYHHVFSISIPRIGGK